jgi:tetratricopeptide (TPR) repeat protein
MNKPFREYVPHVPSILSFVSLVLGILSGFTQLLGPRAKWVFTLASAVGAVWLWLARKPSRLAGAPSQPSYPKRLRIGGTVAAGLVAIVSFGPSVQHWLYEQWPTSKVIVVLARFDDPDKMHVRFGLLKLIKPSIDSFGEYAKYVPCDTSVLLGEETDTSVVAKYGQKYKATILIWGSCYKTDSGGLVTTHFQVLRPPRQMPQLSPEAQGQLRQPTTAGLSHFQFQTQLGDEMAAACLMTLGMVHYSAGDYAGAVRPLLAALSRDSTAHLDPSRSVATRFYLGNAYSNLAGLSGDTANCRKAIATYDQVLQVYTRADSPAEFARTQNNLGTTYGILAEAEDKAENCRRAIAAYQEALGVDTLGGFPTHYIMTETGLGAAYGTLAGVESTAENCRLAIAACGEALRVDTLKAFRTQYAVNKFNLGADYVTLAGVEDTAENCRLAIRAYQEALEAYRHGGLPTERAMTQAGLGYAYVTLAWVEDKAENCGKAIAACGEALRVYTLERFPRQYAVNQDDLGNAYLTLAEVGGTAKNCRRAIAAYGEALRVYTLEGSRTQYAMTQSDLGAAYSTLAGVKDTAENCRKANAAYREALGVYTLDTLPVPQGVVQNLTQLRDWMKEHGVDSE